MSSSVQFPGSGLSRLKICCSGLDSSSTLSKPTTCTTTRKRERDESPWSSRRTACMDEARASYVLEEEVQLWVAAGVDGDLEQGQEDVLQHLLEGAQLPL